MTDARSLGLLEREAESAAVQNAVKAAAQGHGGMLLVEGPAGIGKTRLLAEARTVATETGLGTSIARASELERDFAFGVVRQSFEPLLAHSDPAKLKALWEGPAAQARQVFTTADATTGPAGDFAVLHGLYWLTANTSQDRPLVLLIDDLQWCDAPSLRYLAYLLPRIEDLAVLVIATLRTGETATDERLLQQITTDQAVRELRPHPLSARATGLLLEQALPAGTVVDPQFTAACHEAAGGSPLLLRELARTLAAKGLAASADNATQVAALGPPAVSRLVTARLAHLPEAAAELACAVAVLGDRTDLTTAARLAGQDIGPALEAATALKRVEILSTRSHENQLILSFVHPLVRVAVYDTLNFAERATAHHQAAQILTQASADPERIAAHLLRTPPAADPDAVAVLRTAAAQATSHGAPAGAYTYLQRALREPPAGDQRFEVLLETGQAALLVDLEAAAGLLQQAYDQSADPVQKALIAAPLGTAYIYLQDPDRGLAVMGQALAQLPPAEEDHRRSLQASLLAAATWFVPGQDRILGRLDQLRRLPRRDGIGSRLLEWAIAGRETALGDPAAPARAHRALADGTLVELTSRTGEVALITGWNTLLGADDDTVTEQLQAIVEQARLHGSLYALAPLHILLAIAWLWQGQLVEAEQQAREALRIAALTGADVQVIASGYLADALAEQGRLDEAEQVLLSVNITATALPSDPVYPAVLTALARLLILRGRYQDALDTALYAEQVCQTYDFYNSALSGRTEAALALHALGRTDEAHNIAADNLRLARRWGAPRLLGRAMRVNSLLTTRAQALELLQEAVSVLENSPARLEHAKALADLGSALRRMGQPAAAREPLRRALDLATRCGATPLAEHARNELAAAGGRSRTTALTGPDALTPSERRVAELAATGTSNRQIAQQLYVTPKTVEVHLSATYRKLGITTRTQLAKALITA
ncbi:helix-turn-helix transcriptional regulator [Streptomyces sp. NPDC001139]